MKLAYVAGPYRASTESGVVQNIRNAEAVAIELWRMGYAVLCPHKNTALFGGLAPDEVWLKGDLVMMERCDLVVCAPGWRASSGSKAEVARAENLKIPVYETFPVYGQFDPKTFDGFYELRGVEQAKLMPEVPTA